MRFKKLSLLVMLTLVVSIFSTTLVLNAQEVIDPDIPDSWYEAPKTASELNITSFNQSPMLAEKEKDGEIPPLEKRLSEDPVVVEPYGDIGNYGGTATLWSAGSLLDPEVGNWNGRVVAAAHPTPSAEVVPYFIKNWEYSDNAKSITLYLREGIKWSDGELLTADDYIFWWEHEATNEVLNPSPPEEWNPPISEVTKKDDFTVTFQFDESAPNAHMNFIHTMGPGIWELPPAHYMKNFHPDFVEEEEILEMAEEVGLDRWEEYYQRVLSDSPNHPEYENRRPVLTPFMVVERSENQAILERNPFFSFIDSEGNQLPYIDKIRNNLANDSEMAIMKAATGEATFGFRHVQEAPENLPLYKRNEEKENYTTNIYRASFVFDVYPNLTHSEEKYRKIFTKADFRRALSLAIDRENVSEKVFYGEAIPTQSTINQGHDNIYEEEHAQSYAEFDPERAKELLDKIGMVDINEDGYRETPDGETFNPTLLFIELWSAPKIFELVRSNWHDVGLNIEIKNISRELFEERWPGNQGDMGHWVNNTQTLKTLNDVQNFVPIEGATQSPWPAYVNWYTSDGESGEEPPEDIKQLIEWGEAILASDDEEEINKMWKNILDKQAENVYRIGITGYAPKPAIVSNKLFNVPKTGILSWSVDGFRVFHPEQFYLDE